MSDAYDPALQDIVLNAAKQLNISNKVKSNGTYCFVSGPSYETKAECRFLQSIGGDSVGMSTVPEVVAAKHCGMKILGLSLITNKVVIGNDDSNHATHSEVLKVVEAAGHFVEQIVKKVINKNVIGPYLDKLPPSSYTLIPAKAEEVKDPATNSDFKDILVTVVGVAALVGGLFVLLKKRK